MRIAVTILILFTSMHLAGQDVALQRAIPPGGIKVHASSEHPDFPVTDAVNGSGLRDGTHISNGSGKSMWISMPSNHPVRYSDRTREGAAWIVCELEREERISSIRLWNHNQSDHTRRGLQKVYIEYSNDAVNWTLLKDGANEYHMIPKAVGRKSEPPSYTLEADISARYFCFTADLEAGNHYRDGRPETIAEAKDKQQDINYYGLAEVVLYKSETLPLNELDRADQFYIQPSPAYLRTPEGPKREFTIRFRDPLYCGADLEVEYGGKTEKIVLPQDGFGITTYTGRFPAGFMEIPQELKFRLSGPQSDVDRVITVPPARKWELHFLAHSHLDIGYTHRQDKVMELQWDNLERAVELAERTADYPEGAAYKWNTEATWPLKGYLDTHAGTPKAGKMIRAIRQGYIGVDASLGSILTGISKQEELMHIFDDAHAISEMTGMDFSTAMTTDLPGHSWGYVEAMAKNGVRYLSSAPNYVPFIRIGAARVGLSHNKWGDRPFYWTSPSGKEKILFWATGKGYSLFHGWLMDKLSVCGTEPLWNYLNQLEAESYPYDITYLRYTIHGDNGPPDTEMPDLIRQWNEKYEYPRFNISTTQELFTQFEQMYRDVIPTYTGDFTPVWEDGAASTAAELAMNRQSADRLNQSEILWSLLDKGNFPLEKFRQAWKNVILFSEHTWGASASGKEPESQFTRDLWEHKRSFALGADKASRELFYDALASGTTVGGSYIHVVNTGLLPRTDVVHLPADSSLQGKCLFDREGKRIPVQEMKDGSWVFIARMVPPLSSSVYTIGQDPGPDYEVLAMLKDGLMDNGMVKIALDSIYGSINDLVFFNQPYNYAGQQGLNKYIYTGRQAADPQLAKGIKFKVLDDGEVAATVRVEADAPGCNYLWSDITLYRELARVDILNTLDRKNVYDYENVRFAFDFNIPNCEVIMDLAFGEMIPERDQLAGSNKNFYSIHNGLAVRNLNHGVILLSPDAPFVETGKMTAETWMEDPHQWTTWAMTAENGPTVYSWIMNNSWTTNYKASQEGIATFRYSLLPAWPDYPSLKKSGHEMAQSLVAFTSGEPEPLTPLFTLPGNKAIQLSTIVPSQDGKGYVARFFNMSSKPVKTSLQGGTISSGRIYQCDHKERPTAELDPNLFWLMPYETVMLKIETEKIQ